MRRKTTLLTVGGVAVLGVAGASWWVQNPDPAAAKSAAADATLFTVARGPMDITLTENGTLVAKDSQVIKSDVRRGVKISFLIEEGKVVEEGEEICRFETTELEEQIEQLGLDIVKADADLNSAQTEVEIQQSENESSITKAEIALDKAQKELEKYLEGDYKKESRNLDIAIKDAEQELEKARKVLNDSKMLFGEEFITQEELEQDQISFDRAVVRHEGSLLDLDIYTRFTHPMALKDKEVALDDARRGLETARKRAVSALRQKEVSAEQYEKRLERLNKQLEEREEDLGKMVLTAPCPGIIIHGNPQFGWFEEIKVGSEVWPGLPLMTIPDLRVMQVKLQVHEADISKLNEGQATRVTMDSYPGLVLDGKVTKIANIANSRSGGEIKKFDVDITLDQQEDLELRPGISARAEIQVDRREDAISIPLQCAFVEQGLHYCWVMADDQIPEQREVEPGLSNDTSLEVLGGLEEGERVLLYNPNLPTSGEGETDEEALIEEGTEPPAEAVGPPTGPPAGPPAGGPPG